MDLHALKRELVPAILAYQKFRDATPDAEWDELQDNHFTEMFLDALCEVENTLIQDKLVD
jgi:hypothetical protein